MSAFVGMDSCGAWFNGEYYIIDHTLSEWNDGLTGIIRTVLRQKYALKGYSINLTVTNRLGKCVEIIKNIKCKIFPFGSPAPYDRVTVK